MRTPAALQSGPSWLGWALGESRGQAWPAVEHWSGPFGLVGPMGWASRARNVGAGGLDRHTGSPQGRETGWGGSQGRVPRWGMCVAPPPALLLPPGRSPWPLEAPRTQRVTHRPDPDLARTSWLSPTWGRGCRARTQLYRLSVPPSCGWARFGVGIRQGLLDRDSKESFLR